LQSDLPCFGANVPGFGFISSSGQRGTESHARAKVPFASSENFSKKSVLALGDVSDAVCRFCCTQSWAYSRQSDIPTRVRAEEKMKTLVRYQRAACVALRGREQ